MLKKKRNLHLLLLAALMVAAAVFSTTVEPEAIAAGTDPFKVGSTTYATWEAAINAAGNSGTVILVNDYAFPAGQATYTIPVGVTVVVPLDASHTTMNSATADHPYANETTTIEATNVGKPASDVTYTMTIPEGITLENNGTLVVGGTIYSKANSIWSGATSGAHSNLDVNGTLDLRDNSILAVTGYVIGSGLVKADGFGAKIYEPMSVEFRGGGHTEFVAAGNKAVDGESNLSPFFQWKLQNIQCDGQFRAGNCIYAYVDMYADSKHNLACPCVVGYSADASELEAHGVATAQSGVLTLYRDSTILYTSYESDKHPSGANSSLIGTKTLLIHGRTKTNLCALTSSMSMKVSGANITTTNYNFAIPWNWNVEVENGTLRIATKTQMLPGSQLYIAPNAQLDIRSQFFIYDGANDYTATAAKSTYTLTYGTKNNTGLIYPSTENLQASAFGGNGVANLIVDGRLYFGGSNATTGQIYGTIQTTGSGVIDATNTTVASARRQWGGVGKYDASNCADYYCAGATVRELSPVLYVRGVSEVPVTLEAGKIYYGQYTDSFDEHNDPDFTYDLYTDASNTATKETHTETLNAKLLGSWGDTSCTLQLLDGAQNVLRSEQFYLMDGQDLTGLDLYTDAACTVKATALNASANTVFYTQATARIVETESFYADFGEAVNTAENGQTVQLLKNVTNGNGAAIPAGKSVVIDLNGCSYDSLGTALTVSGSLDLVGTGTLTYAGSSAGNLIEVKRGGVIGTIGGPNSDLHLENASGGSVISLAAGGTIDTIGGDNGRVNILQSVPSGYKARAYALAVSGMINQIGGANSTISITSNKNNDAFVAAIYLTAGGRIIDIGGTNAEITITENRTADGSGLCMGIWLSGNGTIDKLGSAGQVTINCQNSTGVYVGANYLNIAKIGSMGDGGNVTINAPTGIRVEGKGNNDNTVPCIDTVAANGGEVTINGALPMVLSYGTKVGTLGGPNGTLNLNSTSAIALEMTHGHIDRIGSENSKVTLTTASTAAASSAIYFGGEEYVGGGYNTNSTSTMSASIGTIGATGENGFVKINSASQGINISTSGSSIDYIGGANGKVEIDSAREALSVSSGATVGTVGGTSSQVTITGSGATGKLINILSGATVDTIGGENSHVAVTNTIPETGSTGDAYSVYVAGTVNKIGGKNAQIDLTTTNSKAALNATLYVNGKVTDIGGEGAVINIVMNSAVTSKVGMPVWVSTNGELGTLGSAGTVNITHTGTHTGQHYGIWLGSSSVNTPAKIGTIGDGGIVNITAPAFGVRLDGNDSVDDPCIGTIAANGGTVEINAGTPLYIVNKSTLGALGGENGTVKLNASGANVINHNNGGIASIGAADGAVVLMKQNGSGIGYGLNMGAAATVGTIGGSDSHVEIIANNSPVYASGEGTIGELTGNTLLVARNHAADTTIVYTNTPISLISGGYYHCAADNTAANMLAAANLANISEGKRLSSQPVQDIVSLADGNTYASYAIVGNVAKVKETGVGYDTLEQAIEAAQAGQTVVLQEDIALETGVTVAASKDFTLDLNNYSLKAPGNVITNNGKLNVTGGALGDSLTPGLLENTNTASGQNNYAILNYGTMDTIGGNLSIKTNGTDSAAIATFGGSIGTIGGPDSSVVINAKNIGVYVTSNGTIGSIGGEGGKVTISATQNAVEINKTGGSIGTVGGTGSTVNLTSSANNGIKLTKGMIERIGGEDCTVNITARYAMWISDSTEKTTGTVGTIGSTGDGIVRMTGTWRGIYLYPSNTGSRIETIGGEGGKVEINAAGCVLNVQRGNSVGAIGGRNSHVVLNQTKADSAVFYNTYADGPIGTIGGENAHIEFNQINISEKAAISVIQVNSSIDSIGAESGCEILMNQTIANDQLGYGLYLNGGSVGTIGNEDGRMEIIAKSYPIYTTGSASSITELTGNTILVAKTDASPDTKALNTVNPIGTISGGSFCCVGANTVEDIFTTTANFAQGKQLNTATIPVTMMADGETYDCWTFHVHSASNEFSGWNWGTENGQKTAAAVFSCTAPGCPDGTTEFPAEVKVTSELTETAYVMHYTATVTVGGTTYTDTLDETLTLAEDINAYYDDRLSGDEIIILDPGMPTSYKVGTETPDDAVVTVVGDKVIATGVGTAIVSIDGRAHRVNVTRAPISLFMITGHSIGMGSRGDQTQSIVSEDGQVYAFHHYNHSTRKYTDYINATPTMGLGYASETRPLNVDAFTEAGSGFQGEDSGIAWEWNRRTGEKVYVVNAAVGSTSLYQWYMDDDTGSTNTTITTNAINIFRDAQDIISHEVAAGHYELKDMALLYHGQGNFGYRNVSYTQEDLSAWYDSFMDRMRAALNRDVDGDGAVDTISIGFVPLWSQNTVGFGTDSPATMFMGVSNDAKYADMFTASLVGRDSWSTNAKVAAYFADFAPNVASQFTVQNGSRGDELAYPTTTATGSLYYDTVHYLQPVYNAMGIDIADNMVQLFRGTFSAEDITLELLKTDGRTVISGEQTMGFGDELILVPHITPVPVNDLTIETTGSMAVKYPLTIYPNGGGEGALTIKYGDTVLASVTITMPEDAAKFAEIVETGETFWSLQEAVAAAASGQTIRLIGDGESDASTTIPAGKSLTLDLNEHTYSASASALVVKGTLDVVGKGTLEYTGASSGGAIVVNSGGHMNTVGGAGSDLNIVTTNGGRLILVNSGGTIDAIGGDDSKLTMTQTIPSTASQSFGVDIQGTVNTIGGENAVIRVTTNNAQSKINAPVRVWGSGAHLGAIGGENAVIDIEMSDTAGGTKIAMWVYNGGTVDNIGSAGTLNITSNRFGLYIGANWLSQAYVGAIGDGGTVNITAPSSGLRVEGKPNAGNTGPCIGTVAAGGGEVTINSATPVAVGYGSKVDVLGGPEGTLNITSTGAGAAISMANGRIETLGDGGDVNITAASGTGISLGGSETTSSGGPTVNTTGVIGTVAENGGTVTINASTAAAIHYGSEITTLGGDGGILNITGTGTKTIDLVNGAIGSIGGADSQVTIASNTAQGGDKSDVISLGGSEKPVGSSDAVTTAGHIGTIGATGDSGFVKINASSRAIYLTTTGSGIDYVGGDNGTVEFSTVGPFLHLVTNSTVGTIGGENSVVTMTQTAPSDFTATAYNKRPYGIVVDGTINLIGGKNAQVDITSTNSKADIGATIIVEGKGLIRDIGGEDANINITHVKNNSGTDTQIALWLTGTSGASIGRIGDSGTVNLTSTGGNSAAMWIGSGTGNLIRIDSIGGGGHVTVTGPRAIYMNGYGSADKTVDTIGTIASDGGIVEFISTGRPITIENGTIGEIGGEDGTVKLSAGGDYAIISSVATNRIGAIGAASGSKVLISQTGSATGAGLYVVKGSVGTVGSDDSHVEILAKAYPIQVGSAGTLSELTGNTYLIASTDAGGTALNQTALIGEISGGYYCSAANNVVADIFSTQSNFAEGKTLCDTPVKRTAEIDGQEYDFWYFHEHIWSEPTYTWSEDNTKVTASRTCSNEIDSHTETETVDITVTDTATCAEAGVKTYTSAAFENEAFEVQTKTETSPALGHDWDEITYVWSEDNSTVTATRICKRDETHKETETVNTDSEVTKPATCETKGETTYTATFENTAFETQTKTVENIAALGHDWGEWKVTSEPTCTEPGVETRVCKNDETHIETRDVAALGHTEGEPVHENEVPATCKTEGSYDEVVYCTVCGEELSRETKTTGKLAHTEGEPVTENEVPATCTEDGSHDEVVYCTVCKAELSRETVVDKSTGHTAGEPVIENEVPATCSAAGSYDEVVYCTVCGEEISRETKTIKKLAHIPGEPVVENEVAATCEDDGSYDEVIYCTVCGEAISRETKTIAALGHDWGEWEVTKEATCEEEGARTRTCSRCGDVETHPIPVTDHDYVEEVITKPTCETEGTKKLTCRVCGESVTEIIPALGHDWGDPVYTWDEDNSHATATVVCAHDPEHVITETQKTDYKVTSEPTETEEGRGVYTAEFDNELFEPQSKEVTLPKVGVEYDEPEYEWADDYSTVTATTVNLADEEDVLMETVDTMFTVDEPATCDEEGSGTYHAVFENAVFTEQTKTVTIPATGEHTWGEWIVDEETGLTVRECEVCGELEYGEHEEHVPAEPTYEWTETETGYSVTATVSCKFCDEVIVTETVEAELEVITEATADEPGQGIYTATFESELFETQTKEVELPKLEGGMTLQIRVLADTDTIAIAQGDTPVELDETLATGTLTADEQHKVSFTVSNPQACIVLIAETNEDDETVYERIEAQETEVEGVYLFEATVEEGAEIIVAVRGDINLDGTADLKDAMIVMQSYSQAYVPSELEVLVADFDDDVELSLKDAMIVMQIYSQAVDPANLW